MSSRLLLRWSLAVLTLAVSSTLFVNARQPSFTDIESKIAKLRSTYKNNLFDGTIAADPKNKDHVEMIDLETQLLVWRFVADEYQPSAAIKDKNFAVLRRDLSRDITSLTRKRDNTVEAAKLFTSSYVKHARSALNSPKRSAVNAINLMWATEAVAKLGQGELADLLVDVLKDEVKREQTPEAEIRADVNKAPNDGLKLWTFRVLQELLSQPPLPPLLTPILDKPREEEVCKVLTAYITTSVTYKDGTPPQLIDGRRVLRREALKALGMVGHPSLPDKKTGSAMTMLRILAGTDMSPEPGIEERVEAAIGLAKMRLDADPTFHADCAVNHIAVFLDDFVAFCNDANKDLERPVRIYAAQLNDGLAVMQKQLDDPVVAMKIPAMEKAYLLKALPAIRVELSGIEKDGKRTVTTYNLAKWRNANAPVNDHLYTGVPESKVTPKKSATP